MSSISGDDFVDGSASSQSSSRDKRQRVNGTRKRRLDDSITSFDTNSPKRVKQSEQSIKKMLSQLSELIPPHPKKSWVVVEVKLSDEHKWPPPSSASSKRRQDSDSSLTEVTLNRLHQIWLKREVTTRDCPGYEESIIQEGLTERRIQAVFEDMEKTGQFNNYIWLENPAQKVIKALYLWRDIQLKRIENHFCDYYLKMIRKWTVRRVQSNPRLGWVPKPGGEFLTKWTTNCVNGKILTDDQMAAKDGHSSSDVNTILVSSINHWPVQGKQDVFKTFLGQVTAPLAIPPSVLRRLESAHDIEISERVEREERSRREKEIADMPALSDNRDQAKLAAVERTIISHDEVQALLSERDIDVVESDEQDLENSKSDWVRIREMRHNLDRLELIIYMKELVDINYKSIVDDISNSDILSKAPVPIQNIVYDAQSFWEGKSKSCPCSWGCNSPNQAGRSNSNRSHSDADSSSPKLPGPGHTDGDSFQTSINGLDHLPCRNLVISEADRFADILRGAKTHRGRVPNGTN